MICDMTFSLRNGTACFHPVPSTRRSAGTHSPFASTTAGFPSAVVPNDEMVMSRRTVIAPVRTPSKKPSVTTEMPAATAVSTLESGTRPSCERPHWLFDRYSNVPIMLDRTMKSGPWRSRETRPGSLNRKSASPTRGSNSRCVGMNPRTLGGNFQRSRRATTVVCFETVLIAPAESQADLPYPTTTTSLARAVSRSRSSDVCKTLPPAATNASLPGKMGRLGCEYGPLQMMRMSYVRVVVGAAACGRPPSSVGRKVSVHRLSGV